MYDSASAWDNHAIIEGETAPDDLFGAHEANRPARPIYANHCPKTTVSASGAYFKYPDFKAKVLESNTRDRGLVAVTLSQSRIMLRGCK